ncbi:Kiwa anti-phage protein KwaB-like domain-containing protein [Leuconostoc lactis]|uniref:Kiwa anti-phage protein KwaB-like domain-containing protein n=1 Tax=Leuconostoc lactis TaxID=1246 RepID=UPI0006DCBEDF|nr:Kiwa anti-phage protein KwaB-like domain-containing protein [Leuconostoc lactis]KQB82419.1 hypothetical protein AN225_02865 [Leuconostoc lactis]QEA48128.1 DUF4868 domain-containing protein [Leuconostoc lactis]
MAIVKDIFDKTQAISGSKSHGNVTLYLMRYRQKTIKAEKNSKVITFPSFYDAKLDNDLQEEFVKLFLNSSSYYSDLTYDYSVNGSQEDGVAVVHENDFENVTKFIGDLKQGSNVLDDMSQLNLARIKAYIVRLSFGNDDDLYFFGSIKNYSQLQKKSVVLHKSINKSKLKKFDMNDTIGFDFYVNMFWYDNDLYIANANKFESVFQMSRYYKEKAEEVLNTIVKSDCVMDDDIIAINNKCKDDSRIAKKVMKLKFREDRIKSIYENLNQDIFDEITNDSVLKDKYELVKYENGKLTMVDNSDLKNIHEYLNFIADTAKRGIASKQTSSENF